MKTNFSVRRMRLFICILTLWVSPPAVHAQIINSSNSAPLLTITYPTNRARFIAPADLGISVAVNDPDERVGQVEFFANTNLIAISELPLPRRRRPPWFYGVVGLSWSFVPVGEYTLTAVARGMLGEHLGTSAPVKITVEFSCEHGIVILPQVSGRVQFFPEFGLMYADAGNDLQPPQSMYDKTTADNREFRRGFAEFTIPVLPVPIDSAHLVLTASPTFGDEHELSYYVADLTLTTNDFDQPTIPWRTFALPPNHEEQTLVIDVTTLVAQFEGANLGFRLKLADDPAFDQIATRGAGFNPPRLVLNTCSNSPPRVSIFVRDPIASERQWLRRRNPAEFVVWRAGPTNSALTVYYSVKGSAANGIDYETLPGTVTIPAGRRFARVMVRPSDDSIVERTESVVLNLGLTPPILDPNARLALPPPYLLGSHRRAAAFIFDNDYRRWFGR